MALRADVCVVGSGPVGQAAASDLARRGRSVLILEAGDDPGGPANDIAIPDGASRRDRYPDASTHREIALGGTSHRWSIPRGDGISVRLQQLNPGVFGDRPGLSDGWPLTRHELEPYYALAAKTCRIAALSEDPDVWPFDPNSAPLKFGLDDVTSQVAQLGPKSAFAPDGQLFTETPLVRTLVNTRATRLITTAHGERVTAVEAMDARGQLVRCEADAVVLALGAIGNATLLLASANTAHPAGIGNHSDHLGRHFTDHPIVRFGYIELDDSEVLAELGFYDGRTVDGAYPWGTLGPSAGRLADGDLLDFQITLMPASEPGVGSMYERLADPGGGNRTGSVMALRDLVGMARDRRSPSSTREALRLARELARGGDDLARYALSRLPNPNKPARPWGYEHHGWSTDPDWRRESSVLQLVALLEQGPDRDNRVVLTGRRDRFGNPRFLIDWAWTAADRRRAAQSQTLLLDRMSEAGLGAVVAVGDGQPERIRSSAHHHAGTTRMSADPANGVVDATCRIHGVANAYVVGSSVFPCAGAANPTLTGVALAHLAAAGIVAANP